MLATKENKVSVNIPSAEKWTLNQDGTYNIKISFSKDVYNQLRIELDTIPEYISAVKTSVGGIELVAHSIADVMGSFLTFIMAPTMKRESGSNK